MAALAAAVGGAPAAAGVAGVRPEAQQRAANRARTAPPVTCTACFVVDDTGTVLWSRRASAPLPNASTTKMVTALVVVEHDALGDEVVVSRRAARVGEGGLDLNEGERYSVKALLYAMLLTSSNEAAEALAEHTFTRTSVFVHHMNVLARRIGATHSHFVTPHGLDRPGHHSSARDLAVIGAALLGHPVLAAMVAAPRAVIRGPSGRVVLENTNSLLQRYRGLIGVKTGTTDAAGHVLVAAARRHHRRLIAVAMHSRNAFADCRRLLDLGWRRLARAVIVPARLRVGRLTFDPSGSTVAATASAVRGISDPSGVTVVFRPRPGVRPPLAAGDAVGRAVVMARHREIAAVTAVAVSALPPQASSPVVEALGAVLSLGHRVAATVARW